MNGTRVSVVGGVRPGTVHVPAVLTNDNDSDNDDGDNDEAHNNKTYNDDNHKSNNFLDRNWLKKLLANL